MNENKKRKGLKYDGVVIFLMGVNFGEKSAVLVEHGCRVGVARPLSSQSRKKAHSDVCKENHKKGHAAASRGNRHGAAGVAIKRGRRTDFG